MRGLLLLVAFSLLLPAAGALTVSICPGPAACVQARSDADWTRANATAPAAGADVGRGAKDNETLAAVGSPLTAVVLHANDTHDGAFLYQSLWYGALVLNASRDGGNASGETGGGFLVSGHDSRIEHTANGTEVYFFGAVAPAEFVLVHADDEKGLTADAWTFLLLGYAGIEAGRGAGTEACAYSGLSVCEHAPLP